jgi:hypothetical protein
MRAVKAVEKKGSGVLVRNWWLRRYSIAGFIKK